MTERPTPVEIAAKVHALYEATPDDRLLMIPYLDDVEREQLKQLFLPTWDGNVISKSSRDSIWRKGLIDRWNGWQFLNRYGFAVLETLGPLDEDYLKKIRRRSHD